MIGKRCDEIKAGEIYTAHEGTGSQQLPPRKKRENDPGNRGLRMGLSGILGREKIRKSLTPLESDPQTAERKEVRGSVL